MAEQYDLYGGTPPHEHVPTSEEAAESIREHANRLAAEVYKMLHTKGAWGATCDELEVFLQMRHQTCSARVRELFQRGYIRDSDRKRTTRSGRRAIVWVANVIRAGGVTRERKLNGHPGPSISHE